MEVGKICNFRVADTFASLHRIGGTAAHDWESDEGKILYSYIAIDIMQPHWHGLYLTSRRAGLSASAELVVIDWDALSVTQPTVSKHWRQIAVYVIVYQVAVIVVINYATDLKGLARRVSAKLLLASTSEVYGGQYIYIYIYIYICVCVCVCVSQHCLSCIMNAWMIKWSSFVIKKSSLLHIYFAPYYYICQGAYVFISTI